MENNYDTKASGAALLLSQRLRRGNLMAQSCPSREVLKHMTSRWGVLVLMALETGTLRFSALRRMIGGVSERMLSQTLQLLEQDGLVDRVAYNVVPPHVEYSLTALGKEAAEKVRDLADWIETSLPRIASIWQKATLGKADADHPAEQGDESGDYSRSGSGPSDLGRSDMGRSDLG